MNNLPAPDANLPIKRDIRLIYGLSLLCALEMLAATVTGILYSSRIYPAVDLLQALLPSDVVLLLIGFPLLLLSMWLARQGRLIGLLLWPGMLFFVFYNYLVYVLAMPLNAGFLMHLSLVMLSAYTLSGLLASIDGQAVRERLADRVPERLAGGILAGLGLLFFLRAAGALIGALVGSITISASDIALNSTDFIIAPAWMICGVLLWRHEQFGYVTGLGLLFQASMLFVGLIIFMLLQPGVSGTPLNPVDVVVVFLLGMVCFIPLALFVRGVLSSRRDLLA